MAKKELGLVAHEKVRWLLQTEPDVLAEVVKFVQGKRDHPYFDVVGPAEEKDVNHYLLKKAQVVPLPTITLHMRMVRGNLTGDPGVEVTCSDAAIAEIGRWQVERLLRMQRPKMLFKEAAR